MYDNLGNYLLYMKVHLIFFFFQCSPDMVKEGGIKFLRVFPRN